MAISHKTIEAIATRAGNILETGTRAERIVFQSILADATSSPEEAALRAVREELGEDSTPKLESIIRHGRYAMNVVVSALVEKETEKFDFQILLPQSLWTEGDEGDEEEDLDEGPTDWRRQTLQEALDDLKGGIHNSFGFMRLRRALRGGPERTMIEREAIEVEAGEKAALREIVAEIDRELGAIPNQEKIRENLELLEENGPLGRWLNGIIRPYAEEQIAFWERHRK